MATPPQWPDSSAPSFHLDQLKVVRAEADKLADETRVTERWVLGGCGAIYTFFFARWEHHGMLSYLAILWIPPLLAIWGGLRSSALYTRILQCGRYVKIAEDTLSVQGLKGWEHWLNEPAELEHNIADSAKVIWWLLVVGTSLLAFTATTVYIAKHLCRR